MTYLAIRFLVPLPTASRLGDWLGQASRLAGSLEVPVAVLVFLLVSWLLVYWRQYLPGGSSLATKSQPATRSRRVGHIALTIVVIGGGLFVRTRVAEPHRVMSTSMVPTLLPGDRILTEKSAFRPLPWKRDADPPPMPKRGDVVVFSANGRTDDLNHLVKRVIGLPGDRISIHMGSISINGWELPSCNAGSFVHALGGQLIVGRVAVEFLGSEVFLAIKVPEDSFSTSYTVLPNEVFVVGDNRGFSEDSRIWIHSRVGGVPLKSLEGRVRRLVFSRDRLLTPLGPELPFTHIDLTALKSGVERCVKQRPTITLPPETATPL